MPEWRSELRTRMSAAGVDPAREASELIASGSDPEAATALRTE